jgi:hypothetical protein
MPKSCDSVHADRPHAERHVARPERCRALGVACGAGRQRGVCPRSAPVQSHGHCANPSLGRLPAARGATSSPSKERDTPWPTLAKTHKAAKRYIYAWGGGKAEGNGTMKDLLGGKGAGLAEMTNAGLPTPPASPSPLKPATTTSPPASSCPPASGKTSSPPSRKSRSLRQGLRRSEEPAPGLGPLRRQVLHAGHDGHRPQPRPQRQTLAGLIALSGNERFGWDAYRRFISMFGRIVMGASAEDFDKPLDAAKHKHGHGAKDTDLTSRTSRPSSPSTSRSSRRSPAATSRPIRTSSSTSPSRPSSPPGSASAPTTTATARRSPTTSAPPSTS